MLQATKARRPVAIVVGLGNPGNEYRNTYHNTGAEALAALFPAPRRGRGTYRDYGTFEAREEAGLILIRPKVHMNESGKAVAAALRRYKKKPEELLVLHDESDIILGNYVCAFGRGAAGHRGVASIVQELKTKDFWRGRIGVRTHPGRAGDFVLKKITFRDREILQRVFSKLSVSVMEKANPSGPLVMPVKGNSTSRK